MENAVYDSASGQLVTGSFMDYGMPHAHTMPVELREALRPQPAKSNPLGVKGTGEAGTTAAIAAVMNAISHAIPNGAADHMDMPATPAKVWEACQKASRGSSRCIERPGCGAARSGAPLIRTQLMRERVRIAVHR